MVLDDFSSDQQELRRPCVRRGRVCISGAVSANLRNAALVGFEVRF
jgi:hypothetical protein